jgi:hypothetical protein
MRTKIQSLAFCLTACLLSCSQSWAQRGPQDTWYETGKVALPTNCDPYDLIVTPEGTLLLSDYGNDKIHELEANGTLISSFGSLGSGNGQFNNPIELAIGPGNRIYVTDQDNHRIQILERNGTFVKAFGTSGTGDGQFNKPRGLAISSENEVFVSEDGNHRIQVFDVNGTFLRSWGTQGNLDGQFNRPLSLDIDDENKIYIADRGNQRIVVTNQWGNVSYNFTTDSRNTDSNKLAFVKILPSGLLSIGGESLERASSTIRIREKNGNLLKTFKYSSEWNGDSCPSNQLSDGTFIYAHRQSNNLIFYTQTYRAIRPNPSKDAPLPEVISVTQPAGTNHLEIKYRITDADSAKVKAGLLAFKDGGNDLSKVIVPKTFVGSVAGKLDENTTTGTIHTVTWDAKADWNVSYGNVEIAVVAQDDRELMNFHFLTLPATDSNSTPLKISRSPVDDSDLLNAWYTLLSLDQNNTFSKIGSGIHLTSEVNSTFAQPSSISGLMLWLDSEDIDADGTIDSPSEDDLMSEWKDKSSNSFSFVAPTGKEPKYVLSGSNGLEGWYFYAGYVKLSSSYSNLKEIAVVSNLRQNRSWAAAVVANPYNRLLAMSGSNLKYHEGASVINGITGYGGTIPTGQNHVVFKTFASAISNSQLHIGSNGDNYENWRGTISEVIGFNRELTNAERQSLHKYFNTKWYTNLQNPLAFGSTTIAAGREYLFNKMNLRQATTAELTRAREAATPGVTNKFTPSFQVGPGERPTKVNEYGFDSDSTSTSHYWVVPKN